MNPVNSRRSNHTPSGASKSGSVNNSQSKKSNSLNAKKNDGDNLALALIGGLFILGVRTMLKETYGPKQTNTINAQNIQANPAPTAVPQLANKSTSVSDSDSDDFSDFVWVGTPPPLKKSSNVPLLLSPIQTNTIKNAQKVQAKPAPINEPQIKPVSKSTSQPISIKTIVSDSDSDDTSEYSSSSGSSEEGIFSIAILGIAECVAEIFMKKSHDSSSSSSELDFF